MSVTSGFFNSIDGDRKYNAEQVSSLFDGIIGDGVLATYGTAFAVETSTNTDEVTVGVGRAWFDHVWILNDAIIPLTLENSDILMDRIDSIVFDVDHTDSVREGKIIVVTGKASSFPKAPTLVNDLLHKQYPIAHVTRKARETTVNKANIKYVVGQGKTPYVTGVLEIVKMDTAVAAWQAQWDNWYDEKTKNNEQWMSDKQTEFLDWETNKHEQLDAWEIVTQRDVNSWKEKQYAAFTEWFTGVKDALSDDTAGKLMVLITEINEKLEKMQKQNDDLEARVSAIENAFNGRTLLEFETVTPESGDDDENIVVGQGEG